jgi:hypothetical protein
MKWFLQKACESSDESTMLQQPILNDKPQHPSKADVTVAPCWGSMFAFFHEEGFILPGPKMTTVTT